MTNNTITIVTIAINTYVYIVITSNIWEHAGCY